VSVAVAYLILVRSMRASLLLVAALLFTACTTTVQLHGRYAASLSHSDIEQIRHVTGASSNWGHTLLILDVFQRDQVVVEDREYGIAPGWAGMNMHVIRCEKGWCIDYRYRQEGIADRPTIVN
jgi:hypothetical protein